LDQVGVERLDDDAPGVDLLADGAVAQNHGRTVSRGAASHVWTTVRSSRGARCRYGPLRRMKMPTSGPGDHQLKRIVLPSGKTIEVVYFDNASFEDAQAAAGAAHPRSEERRVGKEERHRGRRGRSNKE